MDTKVDSDELNLLNSLQSSIISRSKENKESKIQSTEELFGKMVVEDLKALLPISKLQARNEIQNILFKYRMAAMQDSLQRKLTSTTTMIDTVGSDNAFSPSKTGRNQFPANFGTGSFQNNLSPNSSMSSQGNASMGHWIHNMNTFS